MKRHFNIGIYRTNEAYSVFFKVDESKVFEDYYDDDIINLAMESGKLSDEDSDFVDSIEEISQEEYLESTQSFMVWQRSV